MELCYIDDNLIPKNEDKCCTVVAFMYIFNTTFTRANKYLSKYGRRHKLGMSEDQVKYALANISYSKVIKGPYSRNNSISLETFCDKHPEGRYYVVVAGHAIAVIDGVVYDIFNKPYRKVIAAYRIYLESERNKEVL